MLENTQTIINTDTVNSINVTTSTVEALGKIVQHNSDGIQKAISELVEATSRSTNKYAFLATILTLLLNFCLVVIGALQARIYFNTLHEMRISRQGSVAPFLRIEASGNRADHYMFRLYNDGSGPALHVKFFINEKIQSLTEIDIIPPHNHKDIYVDLRNVPNWVSSDKHEIGLRFNDIIRGDYLSDFKVRSTSDRKDRLPIGSTMRFVGMHRSEPFDL